MANSALSNALHSISKHNNIVISGVGSNEILKFDGSNWINQTLVESGIQATISSSARLDASLIGANGNVSNTEYGYLSGVTSDIQTQISAAGGARAVSPTNVDNAVITFVDSGDTFAAEANLTFTGSLLTLTGNLAATNTDGGSYFKRTISATDGLIAPFVITATSTNNMLDTFGSAIEFKLGDNGASDTRVGVFGIERDGADNSGKYRFKLDNAGTQTTVMTIDKTGETQVKENTSLPSVTKGIAKAWGRLAGTTTPTLAEDYNVASVGDGGVGWRIIIYTTDMETTTYPCIVGMNQGGSNSYIFQSLTHAVGSVVLKVYQHNSSNAGTLDDNVILGFVCYGEAP